MKLKVNEIIDAYNNGESMNAIANRFGTYATTVRRILEKYDVKLRHDSRKEGKLYVKDGEKLIEWAKAQGRPVTRAELAALLGKTKLSPSYFVKYPELGKYLEVYAHSEFKEYIQKLCDWLKENNIPYKQNDRTKLEGVKLDVLLLGDYSGLAIQFLERAFYTSKKTHEESIQLKVDRAKKAGIKIIFLNKEHFENLDDVKLLLDGLKN